MRECCDNCPHLVKLKHTNQKICQWMSCPYDEPYKKICQWMSCPYDEPYKKEKTLENEDPRRVQPPSLP